MIVTTGKTIRIQLIFGFFMERNSDTPGMVKITDKKGNAMELPANETEMEQSI